MSIFQSQKNHKALAILLIAVKGRYTTTITMPSRRSRIKATREREERKKRQEKFRKRTKSLFNKTKLLAKDTDAWVALVVRDRAGRVQSFRSSDSLYWPSSIQDLIVSRHFPNPIILSTGLCRKTTYPLGTHEFLEKHAISGC